jgi:hypothetical protein
VDFGNRPQNQLPIVRIDFQLNPPFRLVADSTLPPGIPAAKPPTGIEERIALKPYR